MGEQNQESRIHKYDKRRKVTKSITILLIIGVALVIVLFFTWIFGGGSGTSKKSEPASSEINRDDGDQDDQIDYTAKDNDKNDDKDSESKKDKDEEKEDKEEKDKVETEEVEPSDANVSKAYKGDWKAVGTEQSGPHTTDFSDGSSDRNEIRSAIQSATGLDDMIEFWVGNGGDGGQKVVATVSSTDKSEVYRVYLSWLDEKGWQPTKVEELKEVQY
jgi:hypothetical protein